jgi:cell shape-determining protein MreC
VGHVTQVTRNVSKVTLIIDPSRPSSKTAGAAATPGLVDGNRNKDMIMQMVSPAPR